MVRPNVEGANTDSVCLGVADITLPFLLIEDLFDSQTIDTCKRLFEYLEARVDRLTAVCLTLLKYAQKTDPQKESRWTEGKRSRVTSHVQ